MSDEPFSEPETSNSALRERIVTLERELSEARGGLGAVLKSPTGEAPIESLERQVRNHHAEKNLRQYGRADVVFIDPGQQKQPKNSEHHHHHHHHKRHETQPAELDHNHGSRLHRFLRQFNVQEFTRPPVLHQWLQNGKIYREPIDRTSSRFELFFDLLFVGLTHQIADAAAGNPTGPGLGKYVLTFCPAYSVWSDVRDVVNQFASDDVVQRTWILWMMVLLVGYANNAASLEPVTLEPMPPEKIASLRWTIGFFVLAKMSKLLLNTVYGYWLPLSRVPLFSQSLNSFFVGLLFFISAFLPPLGMYILVSIAILSEYMLKILGVVLLKLVERKDKTRSLNASRATSFSSDKDTAPELSLFPSSSGGMGGYTPEIEEEPGLGIGLENGLVGKVEEQLEGRFKKARKEYRFPAVNIEHHVDRLGAFVTIVLGEMVFNVFYQASRASGLNQQSGRSILGLMVAFNLNWMYFDSEACRNFIHAIRRHWLTGLIFTIMHLPLSLLLLLASAAMNRLVAGDDPATATLLSSLPSLPNVNVAGSTGIPTGIYYFFGTGIGLSVICMAIIGAMHRSLDTCKRRGVLGLSRSFVISTRFVMGLLMALLPMAHERLTPLRMLGVYVAITAALIIEETVSRLERVERESEEGGEVAGDVDNENLEG